MQQNCDFCEIVAGRADVQIVAEWTSAIAFFPLEPATPGHTLVVPRRHVRDLWEADPSLGASLLRNVLELAGSIRAALEPDGMNIINSAGEAATQTVMHLHVHLVPRYWGDDMGPIWPQESSVTDKQTRDALSRISEARLRGK